MIYYYYVLYDRINEKFLSNNKGYKSVRLTKNLYKARVYGTENKAASVRKQIENPKNWTIHKVSASLDVDINPTSEEYNLWKGGCRVESYIAYRQRTGLSVLDIMEIFKVVYEMDNLDIQKMLRLIRSIK